MATRRRRRSASRTPRGYSSPACALHELAPAGDIRTKRIYEPADPGDGYRALVDRLGPRGLIREHAAIVEWLRDLAPGTALRQWFHSDAGRWTGFVRRYRAEMRAQASALEALRQRARGRRLTLLYGARDPRRNHARLLCELLMNATLPRRNSPRRQPRS